MVHVPDGPVPSQEIKILIHGHQLERENSMWAINLHSTFRHRSRTEQEASVSMEGSANSYGGNLFTPVSIS